MIVPLWTFLGATMIEFLVLLAFIAWREDIHDKREQNLLDRVQAGTLSQYKEATEAPKPPPKGRAPLRRHMEEGGEEA